MKATLQILVLGVIVALGVAALPAGAQSPPATKAKPVFSEPPADDFIPPAAPAPAPNTNAVLGLNANGLDDKHKLSPGDKISFQILEDRDPAKSLGVTDSGEIDVPYVGRVSATGKTCRQLAQELKVVLERDFYYRASVVIGLDAASKVRGKIYIWGQVHTQGAIDIPTGENFTVGKAILRAGGFADFANKKKVKLIRTTPDGQKETTELNMVTILEDGKTENDVTVQEDDFIIVSSRLVNF